MDPNKFRPLKILSAKILVKIGSVTADMDKCHQDKWCDDNLKWEQEDKHLTGLESTGRIVAAAL